MPRPLRVQFKDAYYHVYNRGVEKRIIFNDDRDRHMFLYLIGQTVELFQLRLIAYCLMKNHFHLFIQIQETNLSEAMQKLQGQYARYFNERHNRVGSLFQDRYKSSLVEKDSYGLELIRYIHRNPLENAAYREPGEYPWSSYACYTGKQIGQPWLHTKWGLELFDENTLEARLKFIEFHKVDEKGVRPRV